MEEQAAHEDDKASVLWTQMKHGMLESEMNTTKSKNWDFKTHSPDHTEVVAMVTLSALKWTEAGLRADRGNWTRDTMRRWALEAALPDQQIHLEMMLLWIASEACLQDPWLIPKLQVKRLTRARTVSSRTITVRMSGGVCSERTCKDMPD